VESIIVRASRRILPRLAGLSKREQMGTIPANPLFHSDYATAKEGFEVQAKCRHGGCKSEMPLHFSKKLRDLVNIWMPLDDEVMDWPLGFVPFRQTAGGDLLYNLTDIWTIANSRAATTVYKEGMEIVSRWGMKKGELFFFSTCAPNVKVTNMNSESEWVSPGPGAVPGIVHGSFRISGQREERRSMELRFMVFEKTPEIEAFFEAERLWSKEEHKEAYRYFQLEQHASVYLARARPDRRMRKHRPGSKAPLRRGKTQQSGGHSASMEFLEYGLDM